MLQAGDFMQLFWIKSFHNSMMTTTTTTTRDWFIVRNATAVFYSQYSLLETIMYLDDWKITKKRKTERISQHFVWLGHLNIKGSINKTEIIVTYLSWLRAMGFLSAHISPSYTTFRLFMAHTNTHTHTEHKMEVAQNILVRVWWGQERGKHKQAQFFQGVKSNRRSERAVLWLVTAWRKTLTSCVTEVTSLCNDCQTCLVQTFSWS